MSERVLTLPFKGFTPDDVTQIFHKDHKAVDLVERSTPIARLYGKPMCAMENSLVEQIFGDDFTPDDTHNLERGYGVKLKGLETGHTYTYWHTLPILPVWGGQVVKRGQIVAYMGNSGTVYSRGKYVPLSKRLEVPFAGTHLHLVDYDQKGKQVDVLKRLNWNWEPEYTKLDEIRAMIVVLQKISRKVGKK